MNQAERIKSVQTGLIGAVSVGVTYSLTAFMHRLWEAQFPTVPLINWVDFDFLVRGAIALVTGFLFGVTYRYIVRDDDNSHLKTGAVLSFGLVRGLALIEMGLPAHNWIALAVLMVESLLLFAVATVVLEGVRSVS